MKYNLIPIKLKSKNNINLNNNKIFELIKLSFGNNIIQLNYNKNKKEFSKANLEIINFKIYLEKNIGKMKYKSIDIIEEIKLFDKIFLLNNIKRAKIIINNKEYTLKEYILNKKQVLKIKIKFLDNIIHLNSMFSGCTSLFYVYNFQNLNTKYTKTICKLFKDCSSLLYIEDLSYWSKNNINDISKILCSSFSKWNTSNVIDMHYLFYKCSSLKYLPDISKWNISKVKNISSMFDGCSSLEKLPDISKWNTKQVINMSNLFHNCSKIKFLPDISKWDLSNTYDISGLFYKCSSLQFIPDISNWRINNIFNIRELFCECSSLKELPDISKWNTRRVGSITALFYNQIFKNIT